MYRMVNETMANRSDVDGDNARWLRGFVVKRSGSSLNTVRADGDLDAPTPSASASTWAQTNVASSTNALAKVQGESGKTINWTSVIEIAERL
jgi:hypothetical protein